jgi:hypothetical protein
MAIKLKISPKIIPTISSVYNNPNRIFMEYIDNSLDSAEYFFDSSANSYTKPILIKLKLKGENDKNAEVEITDNCRGIDKIEKVVNSIGDSDKKSQTFTNGQFGYGIHSFMATCNSLEVISKFFNRSQALYLPVKREQFNVNSSEDVFFPDPQEVEFSAESGTIIRLREFDRGSWKEIDFNEIKKEITEHFELLLSRGNLTIKLEDQYGNEFYCDPFNYDAIEGDEIYEETNRLERISSRGKSTVTSFFELDTPIRTYIKITDKKIIDKPPLFFIKGRAIGKVGDIFKRSKHISDIWKHPNITGYIDLSYHIEPTAVRTDLKNDNKTRALFSYLEKTLEPKLIEKLDFIKKSNESKHYRSLENELNKVLSKLAKLDSLNYRTEIVSGKDTSLEIGSEGSDFELGFGAKDHGDKDLNLDENPISIGESEGEGFGPSDIKGDLPGEKGEGDSPIRNQESPYAGESGSKRRKSGFNIKISEVDDPDKKEENGEIKYLRSKYVDGTIYIFKNHPDFLERVDTSSRRGEPRVSQRLITYLAGEITVHYKHILQTRDGRQPEYNIALFENLVEFIYQFESMLQHLDGKNLSDITEENGN